MPKKYVSKYRVLKKINKKNKKNKSNKGKIVKSKRNITKKKSKKKSIKKMKIGGGEITNLYVYKFNEEEYDPEVKIYFQYSDEKYKKIKMLKKPSIPDEIKKLITLNINQPVISRLEKEKEIEIEFIDTSSIPENAIEISQFNGKDLSEITEKDIKDAIKSSYKESKIIEVEKKKEDDNKQEEYALNFFKFDESDNYEPIFYLKVRISF